MGIKDAMLLLLTGTLHDAHGVYAVRVSMHGSRLAIRSASGVEGVQKSRLRRGAASALGLTLHRDDLPEWRLFLDTAPAGSWPHALPTSWHRSHASHKLLAIFAAATAAIVAGVWTAGDDIIVAAAPLIPHRVSEPIGRAYLAELGSSCTGSAGKAALDRLAGELVATRALPEPVTISVVDVPDVNAVALPGGYIAVYRGLIAEATSPDEVAGALAHELGHILRQHPNQGLIRKMGPKVVARTLGIDAGKLASLTVVLHGDRAAESEADGDAIGILRTARISTKAVAGMFERQASAAPTENIDFPDSHPSDASRAGRYRAAVVPGTHPSMTAADWQALRSVCKAT